MSDNNSNDSKPGFDRDLIKDLAALLDETNLSEIEVEQSGLRLRVARQINAAPAVVAAAPAVVAAAPVAPAASEETTGTTGGWETHPGVVKSPMVGTIYLSPEPDTPAFIKVGDTVSEGQTLLIVEAMKTMNFIPAPKAGKITQLLIEDGQPIEYDEPLVVIE